MLTPLLTLLRRSWHLLLPSSCIWCQLPVHSATSPLCLHCQAHLPQLPYPLCQFNLLNLPRVAKGLPQQRFDALLALAYYKPPYQHWLQGWKFNAELAYGDALLQQFSQLLTLYRQHGGELPDAIVYVPMHAAKQRRRGFNPAQQLALSAAATLQIPLLPVLQRHKGIEAQVGLNRKQRQQNLRFAFNVNSDGPLPARLALVDDVITTGATANTLCKLLRRHGAQHISVWTVAVTLFD